MPYMKALALTVWVKEFFKSFFFWLPWQPEFFMEFKSLKYPTSTSPKDRFCEVSLKSVSQFTRRNLVSNCSHTNGPHTVIDHNSSHEHKVLRQSFTYFSRLVGQNDPWSKLWWIIFQNDRPNHIELNKISATVQTCWDRN